jgi:DNA-binding response OmpR family regulator
MNPIKLTANNIKLSGKEFQIMSYFAKHAGTALSRAQIFAACWSEKDEEIYKFSNIVDVYVNYLRKKGVQLKTVRGVGYMLEVQP